MKEIWKDIEDYEGLYQVSNLGRVKSLDRKVNHIFGERIVKGIILKHSETTNYNAVMLNKEGIVRKVNIHRLVAKSFIANPQNKATVNHIDGNKRNNRVDNLEWVTQSENVKHSYAMGLANIDGENHPSNKLTEADVRVIKQMLKDGVKNCEIHKIFKSVVCAGTISDIKVGKSWKNVKL